MSATKKNPVLVGVDQSVANRRACDYACEVAAASRAPLLMVQVVEPPFDAVPVNVLDTLVEWAAEELTERAGELRTFNDGLEIECIVRRGAPWDQLATLAVERDAQLVVVGTFGRRGVARALLGSVAEKVVRTSPRPVVTVPAHAFANRSQAGRRLASLLGRQKLAAPSVIAISRGAIPVALEVARRLAAPLDLWLTEPMVSQGHEMGALGEDGHPFFDDRASAFTAEERAQAEHEAYRRMTRELERLRGSLSPGEVWKRTAIVVSDGIASSSSIIAATRAMRSLGAERTIAAAPIVSKRVLAAVRKHCDDVVYVETAMLAEVPECWYRHPTLPTARAARAALAAYDPSASTAIAS